MQIVQQTNKWLVQICKSSLRSMTGPPVLLKGAHACVCACVCAWMHSSGNSDGPGMLSCVIPSLQGLVNQGTLPDPGRSGGEEWLAHPALPEDVLRETVPGVYLCACMCVCACVCLCVCV